MKFFNKKEKYKYPWEKYYKKEQRNITIPDMSLYEYLDKSTFGRIIFKLSKGKARWTYWKNFEVYAKGK